ncbi:MAG: PsiF family protein [Gammaproteobacteria bacterium]
MKMLSALTLTALLGTSAAFAADAPAAPAASTGTMAAPAAKHASLKACNKQADAKKLAGADRSAFVKECHGAKKG